MRILKPTDLSSDLFYTKFIEKVPGEDLVKSLETTRDQTLELIKSLSEEQGNASYEEGKWTAKQVLQHITDTERIFSYRLLRISRNDQTALHGFDQNLYADNDNTANLSLNDIATDYELVRNGTIQLIKSMPSSAIDIIGTSSNMPFTPRIIGWLASGHNFHHCNVIRERYM